MAIIQKIRTRAGLLLSVVIGFALFAFILGDFLTSGNKMFNSSKMTVAQVNGKKVTYPEYQQLMGKIEEIVKIQYNANSLDEQMQESVKEQVWQDLMDKMVMSVEYKKIGISVSGDELFDLIQGQNPHPIIMQLFANPETGALNRMALNGYLQQMKEGTPEQKLFWKYIEDLIYKQRLSAKYNSLLQKGIYVNSLEIENKRKQMSASADFSFIQKPYTAISDSSIKVTTSEIKAYYKEHKQEYKQTESRALKYVEFTVLPSASDDADAKKWIQEATSEFKNVQEVEQYVKLNSDVPYDFRNYKKGELPDTLDTFMFSANLGDVYGPYYEAGKYNLAKLAKINFLPDSVKVSQIVLPANQKNVREIQALADSLKTLAKKGVDFSQLALENSKDASAQEGGDIGWIKEGSISPQFSDSCFFGKTGDIKLTYTQSAVVIVKIISQSTPVKKVQVGILTRAVRASDVTDQIYYSKASEFAGLNNTGAKFEAAVAGNKTQATPVFDIKPLDNSIQNLEKSRELVRWSYEAEEGDVSTVYRFGDKYVVATLTKINEKGYKPLEDLKDNLEIAVKKEKKAAQISTELSEAVKNASSIDDLAGKIGVPVRNASGVRFASYSVPGAGNEPKMIGAAMSAPTKKLSAPIQGENGVYVLFIDTRTDNVNEGISADMIRSNVERSFTARVNYKSFEILKDMANIKDRRGYFF